MAEKKYEKAVEELATDAAISALKEAVRPLGVTVLGYAILFLSVGNPIGLLWGWGILKGKEWARKLFSWICLLGLALHIYDGVMSSIVQPYYQTTWMLAYLLGGPLAAFPPFNLIPPIYLYTPKVRAWFNLEKLPPPPPPPEIPLKKSEGQNSD